MEKIEWLREWEKKRTAWLQGWHPRLGVAWNARTSDIPGHNPGQGSEVVLKTSKQDKEKIGGLTSKSYGLFLRNAAKQNYEVITKATFPICPIFFLNTF